MKHSQTGRSKAAEQFDQLIRQYTLIDNSLETLPLLDKIIEQYPWFSLAHYARTRATGTATTDQHLKSRLPYKPLPAIIFEKNCHDQQPAAAPTSHHSNDPIDKALDYFTRQRKVHNPDSTTTSHQFDTDISENSIADDDKIVTETLANIHLSQGNTNKAIEIYLKLSLLYPEKSTYFANLIDEIKNK